MEKNLDYLKDKYPEDLGRFSCYWWATQGGDLPSTYFLLLKDKYSSTDERNYDTALRANSENIEDLEELLITYLQKSK